jgi:hypothetical protein
VGGGLDVTAVPYACEDHVDDFWQTWTLPELQNRQGTTGVFDVRELGDPNLEDAERTAFSSLVDE